MNAKELIATLEYTSVVPAERFIREAARIISEAHAANLVDDEGKVNTDEIDQLRADTVILAQSYREVTLLATAQSGLSWPQLLEVMDPQRKAAVLRAEALPTVPNPAKQSTGVKP